MIMMTTDPSPRTRVEYDYKSCTNLHK